MSASKSDEIEGWSRAVETKQIYALSSQVEAQEDTSIPPLRSPGNSLVVARELRFSSSVAEAGSRRRSSRGRDFDSSSFLLWDFGARASFNASPVLQLS